jgi:hypothetical protein
MQLESTEALVSVLAAGVSVAAAVVGIVLGIVSARQDRRAQQVEAYRAVHELYDRMIQRKFEHPEFLSHARAWDNSKMACVFAPAAPCDGEWSRYYTFVELCVGFANAVLQARSCKLMGETDYEHQWERLVRLVVTEHYPIIRGFMDEGPYLSQYLRDYLQTAPIQRKWDWMKQHQRLTWRDASIAQRPEHPAAAGAAERST